MILGISGKIGSGKDTVGELIQLLIWAKGELSAVNISQYRESGQYAHNIKIQSGFEIKKFADKVKDIVCLLINCTREQLEDADFKNKELGEEWWYYTVQEKYTHNRIKIPYDSTSIMNDVAEPTGLIKPTPRFLLQFIGTNLLRNQLHPEIWVNALMSNYVEDTGYSYQVEPIGGLGMSGEQRMKIKSAPEKFNNGYPNWIITDTRFENELKAIKDRGGISIRVNRPVLKETSYEKAYRETHEHESEKSLDSATFDFVINNDKDIEHLINEVRKILEKLSLI